MAVLTTKQRARMKKSQFANPSAIRRGPRGGRKTSGAYPIPDEEHGRDALARVAANGTPAEKARVRAAVHKKFPGIKMAGSRKKTSKKKTGRRGGR